MSPSDSLVPSRYPYLDELRARRGRRAGVPSRSASVPPAEATSPAPDAPAPTLPTFPTFTKTELQELMPDVPAAIRRTAGGEKLHQHQVQARIRAAIIVGLRAQGMQRAEIAKALGLTKDTVHCLLRRAREKGYLHDAAVDIAHSIVPGAIETLERAFKGGKLHVKEAIETLYGAGHFKRYSDQKVSARLDIRELRVVIEGAAAEPSADPPEEVGAPFVDAEEG